MQHITTNWDINPQDVGRGVALLKHKNDPGSAYAVMVNLSQGTKVGMVYDIYENQGTNDTKFVKKSLSEWNNYCSFFAIANSLFFDSRPSITYPTLPFPLKQDGVMETYGNRGSISDQNKRKVALNIYSNYASIVDIGKSYTNSWLNQNLAYRSYVGFGKNKGNAFDDPDKQRTLIGLHDANGDGQREYLILLVTSKRLEADATRLLENDFRCDQFIALDGGGSSQLMCKGVSNISSSRPIPVAIVIKQAD